MRCLVTIIFQVGLAWAGNRNAYKSRRRNPWRRQRCQPPSGKSKHLTLPALSEKNTASCLSLCSEVATNTRAKLRFICPPEAMLAPARIEGYRWAGRGIHPVRNVLPFYRFNAFADLGSCLKRPGRGAYPGQLGLYPDVGGRPAAASRLAPDARNRSLAGHDPQLKELSASFNLASR